MLILKFFKYYSTMSKSQEKREYKRYDNLPTEEPIMARFQIRLDKTHNMEFDDWDSVTLMDVSAGGAFFYYKKDLRTGTLLDLKIDISESTPTINCVGEIIRSNKLQHTSVFCIGIKFIDIGKREKEIINTTVDEFLEYKIKHF
jgi:hypothetical protein